jgi:ribosomal protein S18 acetylase RimI-like enzyme
VSEARFVEGRKWGLDVSAALDEDEVLACETRIINCWPAFSTVLVDDWVVRLADGYSGRANSATAVRFGARLGRDALEAIEALYAHHNRPTIFRISLLADAGVESLLVEGGYRQTVMSIGMLGPIKAGFAQDPMVRVERDVPAAFVEGVARHQVAGKRDGAVFGRIVSLIALERGCFTVELEGRDVGWGLGVIDRGYFEISSVILAPEARGIGLGRKLMHAMLAWGRSKGASKVFLQVEANNSVARRLYASLGMTELYEYRQYEKGLQPIRD